MTKPGHCADCDTRIYDDADQFNYMGYLFCCECMGVLVSWFLDGGIVEEPQMYDFLDLTG